MRLLRSVALILGASAIVYADVANMSGKWALNVKRSDWGKVSAPSRVDLIIEHNEPSFKYSGTTQSADGRGPSTFEFDGAIDGKQYPVKENRSERKAQFKRTSDNAIEGVYVGADGKPAERTTMRLLRDGKTLVMQVRLKLPDGTESSRTEVYEKQQ